MDNIFDKHKKRIAIDTLKMVDGAPELMGAMSKQEARDFLLSIGFGQEQIRKIEEDKNGNN